ncbi:MAG: molybdopterin-guanine dinucleotide biosynthesis protein MobA, partial [Methanobrevibacter sp.]|nr:molybdopterin-guanine dinucleotide biosynthesis protein MobA [Candidatus Methanovirga procula]
VLNTDVDECIIVLGHFKDEIKKEILKINDDRIKVVYNNPIGIDLSVSLYNALINSKSKYILAVAGDQSNISTGTYQNLINTYLNKIKDNEQNKVLTVLRRREIGELDSAEGLGMPFATDKNQLMRFLENKDSDLNPILREMFEEGFKFFAIKEKHESELININEYKDYKTFLN